MDGSVDGSSSVTVRTPTRPPLRRPDPARSAVAAAGAISGLVAAAVGIGVGEAAAAAVRPEAAPLAVIGNRFIDLSPQWLTEWAKHTFGTDDKLVLRLGMFAVVAGLAALAGWRSMHRRRDGLLAIVGFTVIAGYCALTRSTARASDVIPSVLAAVAAALVLTVLVAAATGASTSGRGDPVRSGFDRRRFLIGSTTAITLATIAGLGGRAVQHQRFDAARSRAQVVLPPPADTSPAVLPPGTDLGRSPVPYQTPSADFYRIDTTFVTPQVTASTWQLKIHGMVDHPLTITYAELLALPQIQRWITLACVSNLVGGDLVGNALWQGTLLAPLLERAGVQAGADQLVSRSVDGMTIGTPVAAVRDGRDAMLAIGMNGAPLPVAHGFPVRMVVPGLYGYVSACKWISEIEVTTFDKYDAYWVVRGWDQQLPVQLASRIDAPARGKRVQVGTVVAIAGVAWHQHTGIGRVDVRIDGGAWQPARLAAVASADTWRQWTLPWTPTSAGEHRITVRAVDPNGQVQSSDEHDPLPGASSGLHTIMVTAA